jgi:3-oxoacyl-[acyl-carrier protein] reductase
MRARRFGRVVNITSAMVKTPHAAMGLSTAARAAFTALTKALSHEAIADNVTLNNLLPERFDTPRQEFMAQRLMRPEEFGQACAFLCSANAGFMTGQNLQLDGGSYMGLV